MSCQCRCCSIPPTALLIGHINVGVFPPHLLLSRQGTTQNIYFLSHSFGSLHQTDCVCRGFSELSPLLAYLTIALQDSVINAGLNYTEAEQQQFGNLYTSYVQNIADGNAPADEVTAAPTFNVSSGVFASLTNQAILGGAFLPVSKSNFGVGCE